MDTFQDLTDHGVVPATTSYNLESGAVKEEQFLLESGKRFRKVDFSKGLWPTIQARLKQLDLSPMESLVDEDVTAAHKLFMDTILPIME